MKTLVVNVSAPHYNLGALKAVDYFRDQGHTVYYSDGDPGMFAEQADKVILSVIFSWHAPIAVEIASRCKNCEIECGGPGMFALGKYWRDQTGLVAHRGLDDRFENQVGNYLMTFASRGCPVGCSFCIVPKLEGLEFTLNWNFRPAPVLCDNNLSALPVEFQEHIIWRYRKTGTVLKDANSGFEPITFDEGTYLRWKPILRGPWRFAFDTISEQPQVNRMMKILKGESARRKRVYVLIGNEPIATCYERAQKVIAWGGEPYVQPIMPLNALSKNHLMVHYDWTFQKLKDMQRYYNRWVWRSAPIREYSNRKDEAPPFKDLPVFNDR